MSVCILHKDGWGVCDSRDTMGTLILPSKGLKINKAEGYLIASVGQGVLYQDVARIVARRGHEIDVLRNVSDMMSEKEPSYEGECLAVSYKKELIHLDSKGLMTPIEMNFWAIGCVEQFVLGRLLYIEETKGVVTIEDAEVAVKVAAKYDCGIDDRVQKFWLDGIE